MSNTTLSEITDVIVYCIVPTHNRLQMLKQCISRLKHQNLPSIEIIVIDDGSDDGTKEYLSQIENKSLKVIHGSGNMWWGGSVDAGMKYALSLAKDSDYLLLMNDDGVFGQDYVVQMVAASRRYGNSAMVSPQYDINCRLSSYVGYRVDYYSQEIEPVKEEPIDASVGRGLLIPVRIAKRVGTIDTRGFQHYMGDLEYTARIKDYGYTVKVAWDAPVYSDHTPSDLDVQALGEWSKRLHKRSKTNIILILRFFRRRGPIWTRVTAIPRMVSRLGILAIKRVFRRGGNN